MSNEAKFNGLSGVNPTSISSFHDAGNTSAEDAFSTLSKPTAGGAAAKKMDTAVDPIDVSSVRSDKIGTDVRPTGLEASQHRVRHQISYLSNMYKSQPKADNDGYKAFSENAKIQMHTLIVQHDGITDVAKQINTKA